MLFISFKFSFSFCRSTDVSLLISLGDDILNDKTFVTDPYLIASVSTHNHTLRLAPYNC